jgi:hypothetical protein
MLTIGSGYGRFAPSASDRRNSSSCPIRPFRPFLPPPPENHSILIAKICENPSKTPLRQPSSTVKYLWPRRPSLGRRQTTPAMENSGGASQLRGASWTAAGSATPLSCVRRFSKARGSRVRAKAPSPLSLCRRSPRRERARRARRNCAERHGVRRRVP